MHLAPISVRPNSVVRVEDPGTQFAGQLPFFPDRGEADIVHDSNYTFDEWRPAEWCATGPRRAWPRRVGRPPRDPSSELPLKFEETTTMAAPEYRPARFLHEQLAASPDLLRSMLTTFINTLMSAEADAVCGAATASAARSGSTSQRLPPPRLRHPRRHPGRRDPEAALGLLLPGLAARAPPPGRSGPDQRGGDLLPARGLDPADGEAGRDPRDHAAVEVAGLGDGRRPRRAGRGVPHPPARRRAVHRSSPPTRSCSRSAKVAGW